ncbi:MAG: UbiA family prenyltransferase [Conexivisphaerales archaeon]
MNFRQFIALIRVPSLTATVVPLLTGGIIATRSGTFDIVFWLIMFVVALFMQIAANAFNEHGDFINGIDKLASHGFAGIIVRGEVSANNVLAIGIAFYIAAALLAVPLVLARGIYVLVMGLIAAIVGVLYSEGPLPLSRTPFGEIFVGITMGLIEIIATEFISSGKIIFSAYLISVPISLLVADILVANNLRDINKDSQAGRKTLVIILGIKYSQALYYAMIALSYAWLPFMYAFTENIRLNLPLVTLPFAAVGMILLHKNGWRLGVEISSIIYLLYGIALAIALL